MTSQELWTRNPQIIDLLDLEPFGEHGFPHEAFAKLRRDYPVYWNEEHPDLGPGFWNLTRHDDVDAVSRDPATFSSAQGININYPPAFDPAVVGALIGNMITMDPPLHNEYRRVALPFFTRAAIEKLEARIRELTVEILEGVRPLAEYDFMEKVAAPLPIAVLCEIMGVPESDQRKIFDWSNALVGSQDPELGGSIEDVQPTYMELFAYGQRLVQERRENPIDDLMTAIANATMSDGNPIPEIYLNGFFLLMVIAGNETTRNSIAGGMKAFCEHPDQWRLLRENPDLMPSAVEEVLRWVSPVYYMRRTATRDTEIRGVEIKQGDKVVMWYPSANRDEAVFDDPSTFDITRQENRHLAFGIGQHFCLGAQLARLQLRVMFSELVERLPGVELAGPVRWIRTNFLNAVKEMPVRAA